MQVAEPVEAPSCNRSALRPFDGPQGPQAQGPWFNNAKIKPKSFRLTTFLKKSYF